MTRLMSVALWVGGWLICAGSVSSPAFAQDASAGDAPEAPPVFARPLVPDTLETLDVDGVLDTMSGAELRGCYIDGRERVGDDPEWGERTAEDGGLYDLLQGDRRVGRWYTVNQYICYVYEWYAPGQASCFSVGRSEDDHLYFTVAGTDRTIATTDCRAPAIG